MSVRGWVRAAIALAALAGTSSATLAQSRVTLPMTRADALLEDGRWTEAEALFYSQAERATRDPVARAALGRFVAMKGAVRPGMVLIEEARQFGLDPATARMLIAPLRAILEWRAAAGEMTRDSTFTVRVPLNGDALFRIALPHLDSRGRVSTSGDVEWHDVVARGIGLDSLRARGRPMGIEIFEALIPSVDMRTGKLTLHANSRSALSATGQRYQVLRSQREVLVLVADRHALPLADAIRELSPSWWQLDLVHGLLVVR